MKRWCVGAALLLLVHAALRGWLSEGDFMAALAAARHGHVAMAALAAIFLLSRLLVILGLPSLLLARAGVYCYDRWVSPRSASS